MALLSLKQEYVMQDLINQHLAGPEFNVAMTAPPITEKVGLGEGHHTPAGNAGGTASTPTLESTQPAALASDRGGVQRANAWKQIPKELTLLPQWCVAGNDKIPRIAKAGFPYASTTNKATWTDFDSACRIAEQYGLYVGFVLHVDDPFACLDLDVCNAEGQKMKGQRIEPSDWTTNEQLDRYRSIIETFDSYTETLTLGFGFHIWVHGRIGKGRRHDGVEIYSESRFIICTGNVTRDRPISRGQRPQQLLDAMVSQMPGTETNLGFMPDSPETASDDEVVSSLLETASGPRVRALMQATGNSDHDGTPGTYRGLGYQSQSEADMALLSYLTRHSKNNEQCKRIFRSVGLGQRIKATKNDRYLNDSISKLRAVQKRQAEEDREAVQHGEKIATALLAQFFLPKKQTVRPKLQIITAEQMAARPPSRWRIQNVLPEEGLAAIFGAPGSGKSFLSLHMLAAIAAGKPWFGNRVLQAPVCYVPLEGQAGVGRRVQAFLKQYGPMHGLGFMDCSIDLRVPQDQSDFIKALKDAGYTDGVICVDTLAASAPGIDENTSIEMGGLIRNLQDIQRAVGGCILIVHHSGKDHEKGLRGWSGLLAALDACIETSVTKTDRKRKWRLVKSKEGIDGREAAFSLNQVVLGMDDHGEAITSAVVSESLVSFGGALGKPADHSEQNLADEEFIWTWVDEVVKAGGYPSRNSLVDQQGDMAKRRHLTHARIKEAVSRLIQKNRLMTAEEKSPVHNTWLKVVNALEVPPASA